MKNNQQFRHDNKLMPRKENGILFSVHLFLIYFLLIVLFYIYHESKGPLPEHFFLIPTDSLFNRLHFKNTYVDTMNINIHRYFNKINLQKIAKIFQTKSQLNS